MTDEEPLETLQMSMKRGLKLFSMGGEMAVKQEIQQLHDWQVMAPIEQKDLLTEVMGSIRV